MGVSVRAASSTGNENFQDYGTQYPNVSSATPHLTPFVGYTVQTSERIEKRITDRRPTQIVGNVAPRFCLLKRLRFFNVYVVQCNLYTGKRLHFAGRKHQCNASGVSFIQSDRCF